MNSNQNLLEEVSTNFLGEDAGVVDVSKELTAHDWLLSNESNLVLLSIRFDVFCVLLIFVIFHDVLVLKSDCCLNFLLNELKEFGVISFFPKIEDFQGV